MKFVKIKEASKDNLVLFFNGWGMDEYRLFQWDWNDATVVCVYDYESISATLPEMCKGFSRCIVIAWSLGVWAFATSGIDKLLPKGKRIAVNGTLTPIDNTYGIPPAIFHGTIENWLKPNAAQRFLSRMNGSNEPISQRDIVSQRDELKGIEDFILSNKQTISNPFEIAFCSSKDRIFPIQAQLKSWSSYGNVNIIERDWMHDPFYFNKPREEILNYVCN